MSGSFKQYHARSVILRNGSSWLCLPVLLTFIIAPTSLVFANIPKEEKITPREVISITEQWRWQLTPAAPADDIVACREAATAGDPAAQYNMGLLYEEGIQVPKNKNEALNWYRKSADQGLPVAEYAVGLLTVLSSTNANLPAATEYFRKAAEKDFAPAQFLWGYCLQLGYGVSTNLLEAIVWYQKAASNNYAPAQYSLGVMSNDGLGMPNNPRDAVHFYRLAAGEKYPLAQYALGFCYMQGTGVEQDFKEAANLFRPAAEQGLAEAQHAYGICLYFGYGAAQDYAASAMWFKRAVEQNYPSAQAALGRCYLEGTGVETNLSYGANLIRASAECGLALGMRYYGGMFAGGTGVPQNNVEAYKWFTLAILNGDAEAEDLRKRLIAEMTTNQILEASMRASAFVPNHPVEREYELKFYSVNSKLPPTSPAKPVACILSRGIFAKPTDKLTINAETDPTGQHQFITSRPTLKTETNRIPAKLGILFGIACEISGLEQIAGDLIDVQTVWEYPVMAKPNKSPSKGFTSNEPQKVDSEGRAFCFAGYAFENDFELVPGAWSVEVRCKGKILASQAFTVFRE